MQPLAALRDHLHVWNSDLRGHRPTVVLRKEARAKSQQYEGEKEESGIHCGSFNRFGKRIHST
jgi:hypothetical protein